MSGLNTGVIACDMDCMEHSTAVCMSLYICVKLKCVCVSKCMSQTEVDVCVCV